MGKYANSESYRDPSNSAYFYEGEWFRVASESSAIVLRRFLASQVYRNLVDEGSILKIEEVDPEKAKKVLAEFNENKWRDNIKKFYIFKVETANFVTYPWEWTDQMLFSASLLTLKLRSLLLEIGLDLKDASAKNIIFRGVKPVFLDLGSLVEWTPSRSWPALRQFAENFLNPLLVSLNSKISTSEIWYLANFDGLTSEKTRQIMPKRRKYDFRLWIFHKITTLSNSDSNRTNFRSFRQSLDPNLARIANKNMNAKLTKLILSLNPRINKSFWAKYSKRKHYILEQIENKKFYAESFINSLPESQKYSVIDFGGNDGLTALNIVRKSNAKNIFVFDSDSGALDQLYETLMSDNEYQSRIMPLRINFSKMLGSFGLLREEYKAIEERINPTAIICQAVIHHLTITQAIPLQLVVKEFAMYGTPIHFEFATEEDTKVKNLIANISNWQGDYSLEEFLKALNLYFSNVEINGYITETRLAISAYDPKV